MALILFCYFALLASIVYWHKVQRLICEIYRAHYDASNPRAHSKAGWEKKKKSSAKKSFLFFINLRNNILHEYEYDGRYFGLYKKRHKDKKK